MTYEKKSAPKEYIKYDDLWKTDSRTFINKIGFLTNLSTTMFSMLDNKNLSEQQKDILINRLKTCVALQSMTIDFGKGIEVFEIPEHWSKWNSWKNDEDQELIEKKKSNNKILADQKPYFMTFTYKAKSRKFREHIEVYSEYAHCHHGTSLEELLESEFLEGEEKKTKDFYFRYSPITDYPSVMNLLSHHIEKNVKFKRSNTDLSWDFDVDKEKLEKIKELYRQWNNEKRNGEEDSVDIDFFYRLKADGISINPKELAKLALMTNKRFASHVFQDEVLELFKRKSIEIPVLAKDGDKIFNGNRYKLISFDLEG